MRGTAAALVVAAAVGVGLLREEAMYDPRPGPAGTATAIELEARDRTGPAREDDLLLLWRTCTRPLTTAQRSASFTVTGPGAGRAVVRPALGSHQATRVEGCLQDLTVDRIRGRATLASWGPSSPGPAPVAPVA